MLLASTMMDRWILLILALLLSLVVGLSGQSCPEGYVKKKNNKGCTDVNECEDQADDPDSTAPCPDNATCKNTIGSFYCNCKAGFKPSKGPVNFTADVCIDINECLEVKDVCGLNAKCINTSPYYFCTCNDGFISTNRKKSFQHSENATCEDINECQKENVCGQNASCINTQGSYYCTCNAGFVLKSGKFNFSGNQEQCEDICKIDKTICGNGTCHQGASGHYCECREGFTNYGSKKSRCTELNCDIFEDMNDLKEKFQIVHDVMKLLRKNCLEITVTKNGLIPDGEDMLKMLLNMTDELMSSAALNYKRKVSNFLDFVDNALRLIGPFTTTTRINRSSAHTELDMLVHKGSVRPQGPMTLLTTHVKLNIQMEVAAGDLAHYPGFTTVSLMSYSSLEKSTDGFFSETNLQRTQSFMINSKVATVTVSNRNTSHLEEPVKLTLDHLEKWSNQTPHICVFWDSSEEGGVWSDRGCSVVETNLQYTLCSCNHAGSFAVLTILYGMEDKLELQLITWVGLSLSLICLFICILTFSMMNSIKSPRTTILLHLCINLFIANLFFLAGTSQMRNQAGCVVVTGILHFFYLAAFCWMCLEGIHLFRMVVLVFNTNFKTLFMMAGGYGLPAVIVAISAIAISERYTTKKYCWLNPGFLWCFFGPASVIIILAQKFSSLNPDLDDLRSIKAFTVTAVSQLFVLGNMWILGHFQFEQDRIGMFYLAIFGSLEGVMLFVVHCLFSRQVRSEYTKILSRFCRPRKKRQNIATPAKLTPLTAPRTQSHISRARQ